MLFCILAFCDIWHSVLSGQVHRSISVYYGYRQHVSDISVESLRFPALNGTINVRHHAEFFIMHSLFLLKIYRIFVRQGCLMKAHIVKRQYQSITCYGIDMDKFSHLPSKICPAEYNSLSSTIQMTNNNFTQDT